MTLFARVEVSGINRFAIVEKSEYFLVDEIHDFHNALEISKSDLKHIVMSASRKLVKPSKLLAPISGETELWGAGCTYSAEATGSDIYSQVINSERFELFFKGASNRIAHPGDPITIRRDALSTIPEPEVAIVANLFAEVIGYTMCNDVTARSFEEENPLFLQQAKTFFGSSSLGPHVTPEWLAPARSEINISGEIRRENGTIWLESVSFNNLVYSDQALLIALYAEQRFNHGAVLTTGAGIWPPSGIDLMMGDEIIISSPIGVLRNFAALIL